MDDNNGGSADRFRGILTPSDREFLRNREWTNSSSLTRDARYRLRKRTEYAISDLYFLTYTLPADDRRIIFENLSINSPSSLFGAIAFFYLASNEVLDAGSDIFERTEQLEDEDLFERMIREAIMMVNSLRGVVGVPEVSIVNSVVSEPDVEEVRETLLAGEGTVGHLNYLVYRNEVDRLWEILVEEDEMLRVDDGMGGVVEVTPSEAELYLDDVS